MISYAPFYKTLNKKRISKYRLVKDYFISASTLSRIHQNKSITLNTLETLCNILECKIGDIITFV